MKKTAAIIIPLLAVSLLALQFNSCEKFILPEMSVTPDTLFFSPLADSASVTVKANVTWEVSGQSGSGWVSFSPSGGEMEGVVKIKVAQSAGESRRATITFKSETLSKSLIVIQEKKQDEEQEKQD